jgi:hypothetical protein
MAPGVVKFGGGIVGAPVVPVPVVASVPVVVPVPVAVPLPVVDCAWLTVAARSRMMPVRADNVTFMRLAS